MSDSETGTIQRHGATKEEMSALITHMAFHTGWPTAAHAVQVTKEAFDETEV